MAIVLDTNMKLFAERMNITSSRMIQDYGLKTVDEIIEAEACSVSDICKEISSLEISKVVYNSRISLWVKATSHKAEMIFFAVETVMDFWILEQIGTKSFSLISDPCQRKSGSQMNICFTDGKDIQFSCNSH